MGCQKKKKKYCELRGLMIDVTRDSLNGVGPLKSGEENSVNSEHTARISSISVNP